MIPAQNIGAVLKTAVARIPETITAGAGNDNVEVNGPAIDLMGFSSTHQNNIRFSSALLVVAYSATLAAAQTWTLTWNLQTASDSGFTTDVADLTTPVAEAAVNGGGGGTFTGVIEVEVDLAALSKQRYIRLQSTSDLSAGTVDTADVAGILIFGGADSDPQR